MLDQAQVEWVVQLLAEGSLSQRRIALLTGVSRGTIGAIASGRRAPDLARMPTDYEPQIDEGPPVRCRGCGGMVYMPCLLCHVRGLARRGPRIAELGPGDNQSRDARLRPPNAALLEALARRKCGRGNQLPHDNNSPIPTARSA